MKLYATCAAYQAEPKARIIATPILGGICVSWITASRTYPASAGGAIETEQLLEVLVPEWEPDLHRVILDNGMLMRRAKLERDNVPS